MKLEFKGADYNLAITSDVPLVVMDPKVHAFVDALEGFTATLPLQKFEVKHLPSETTKFSYEWDTDDGRVWVQQIDIVPVDPKMKFTVGSWFSEPEIRSHRPLRDTVVALLRNGTTKVEVTFL